MKKQQGSKPYVQQVRSLLEAINQELILVEVINTKSDLVRVRIKKGKKEQFHPNLVAYATQMRENPQIKINEKTIVLSVEHWQHAVKGINPLLANQPPTPPVDKPATPKAATPKTAAPRVDARLRRVDAPRKQEQASGLPPIRLRRTPSGTPPSSRKQDFERNVAIEQLIESKGDERDSPEAYTEEEKIQLARFAGYGGLEKYVTEDSAAGNTTGRELLYEFYTPDLVIQAMWRLCVKHGYTNGAVLEPSVGTGRFLKYAPKTAQILAYEVNPTSATITRILYPQADVKRAYFETMFLENNNTIKDRVGHLPKFDLAIGNPPYGTFTGRYAAMGEKQHTGAKSHIDYFMLRSLDVLRPGGLLCMLVGAEPASGGLRFLQKGMGRTKGKIKEKAELLEAHLLPEGIFNHSSSIGEIILLRKREI